MEQDFWLERWEQGQIGFHAAQTHPALTTQWTSLGLPAGATVLVPLCGKSRDMLWLRAQGYHVLGVELSGLAVRAFFAENGLEPSVSALGRFERYTADGVTLLCGDFFDLASADLAQVSGVYDRAALIALPPDMRERYVATMRTLLPQGAPILLVTLSYPAHEMEGPPFAVDEAEVRRLYGTRFEVELLSSADALADNPQIRQRGLTSLTEQVYRLTPRAFDD